MIMKTQRVTGAGDEIRTDDPNLGTVVHQCSAAAEAKSRWEAPSIGEKLEMPSSHQLEFTTNPLKSFALPRGLEPLFSP
jgi:hypothetical protein